MWDNSSLQSDIIWDNKTLPGMSEEELLKLNMNPKASEYKNTPDHIRRSIVGIKKAWENGVYDNKNKSQMKPVIDPDGKEWPSANDAGEVWFSDIGRGKLGWTRKVRNYCNANKNGWKWK